MKIAPALITLFLALPAVGQELSESVEIHILEIEVVVLDRAGKPVEDLTREDFEVKLDGKPVEVANFYMVRRGEILGGSEKAGNIDDGKARAPMRLIVVVDDLHLRRGPRKRALDALHEFIESSMIEGTTVTLIRWNGTMSTRVKPTTDRASLLSGIREMQQRMSAEMLRADSERRRVMRAVDDVVFDQQNPGSRGYRPDPVFAATAALRDALTYAEDQSRQTRNTIAALEEVIAFSSGLDGRKVLLFVSEALPQQPGAEVLDYARRVFSKNPIDGFDLDKTPGGNAIDAFGYDQTATFRRFSSLAQAAGVVFSALDPGGVRGTEGTGAEYAGGLASLDDFLIRENAASGSRTIAGETGGRFITNDNDLDRAIAVLTDQVSTWYSLGVRAQGKGVADVRVRIRGRDDVRVLTPKRRVLQSAEERLAAALRARLYSREEANPLEARISVGLVWPRNGKCVAPVEVTVPRRKLTLVRPTGAVAGELAIHAVALDDREHVSAVYSTKHAVEAADGEQVTRSLLFGLPPRRYVLSVAIADTVSGETSYLQFEVDATICSR